MTQGQIEALEHHASDEIKETYLPKLISGEWSGTMNLTEPQAGSDVGALRSKAEPNGDGSYKISGQKIYISWGDNDFTENVCHLVLARLPDAAPGTKGITYLWFQSSFPMKMALWANVLCCALSAWNTNSGCTVRRPCYGIR